MYILELHEDKIAVMGGGRGISSKCKDSKFFKFSITSPHSQISILEYLQLFKHS